MIPIVAGCCIDALSRYLSSNSVTRLSTGNTQAVGIGIAIASAVFWNVNVKIVYIPSISKKDDVESLSSIVTERLNSPTIILTDDAYLAYRRKEIAKLFKIVLHELAQIAPLLLGEKFIVDGDIASRLFNLVMKFSSYGFKNMKNLAIEENTHTRKTVETSLVARKFTLETVDRKVIEFFFKNLRESNGRLKYVIIQSKVNNAIKALLIKTILEGDSRLLEIIRSGNLSKEIENSLDYLIDKLETALVLGRDIKELIEKNRQLLEKLRKYEEEITDLKRKNEELENILKRKRDEIISKLFQEKYLRIVVVDGFIKKKRRELIVRAPVYVLFLIRNLMKEYDGHVPVKLIKMLEQYKLVKIVKYGG
ncbi:MAG: hypothetical protein GXO10_02510 [Crenarchaeota archaeon]|nr:hypothetical protein [Thermoproteota archaeon]